ncbi:MAG TPA: exopolyphosphatase [Gammaproteobacteria bacterium]
MTDAQNYSSNGAIAAVDLGSNSFHMIVAEERDGQLYVLDRIRDMVRLASGLDDNNNLSPEVEQTALDCLQKFGQRLRDIPPENVRAVGTNTMRRTNNAEMFLQHAQAALGHPIDIISGIEEARLIYQGVAHSLEQDHKKRLVIDIGGGSTEIIIGDDFNTRMMESLEMGCVTITRKFFEDGKITPKQVNQARIRVLQLMKPIRNAFRNQGWDVVIGSSGTIKATATIIERLQSKKMDGITPDGLKLLVEKLQQFESVDAIKLDGLVDRRAPVFLGGVIVLLGVFEALDIKQMQVSDGALREGLLYDLIGRRHNEDIRNKSVQQLASRFHVDEVHVARINLTAQDFLAQLYESKKIPQQEAATLLLWSCQLHEIGRDIAHSGYQKHSAYIVENSDLAGFSQQEQKRLSYIVRLHRGKVFSDILSGVSDNYKEVVTLLTVILRLSVILHRSRSSSELPAMKISLKKDKLKIKIPEDWLLQHPLTLNDLEQEASYLKAINLTLKVNAVDSD